MLIKTKNILCETKEIFNTWTLPSGPLDTSGDILWSSVVYIKNTGEIWTHGILLGGTLANATADKVDITLNNISKSISLHGHTQPYTTLTGSTTEANQAILSSGVKDKWILKTLGKNAFSNDDFLLANATAESAKRVVNDFIVSIKGESFISFNGSEAKTLNFIPGQNVSILSNSSGDLTISADAGDDTTNTAGATNKEDTKLFLIGAEAQTSSPQTYSNQFVYIGTDNNLYSNGSKVWSSGNDGSGSGLDADTVDGVHNGDLTSSIWKANKLGSTADLNDYNGSNYYGKAFYVGGGESTTNKPLGINAYGLLVLRSADGHTTQLLSSTNVSRGLYWRGGVDSDLGSWNKIAFISDNVASASKLSPGCKIWGKTFTGASDITGTIQNVDNIYMSGYIYLMPKATGGWARGMAAVSSDNKMIGYVAGAYVNADTLKYYYYGGLSYTDSTMYILANKNVGIGTNSPQAKLHVVGDAKIEGEIYSNTNKVWHEGNDGSDSGLDADLLDGKHITKFGQYFDRIPYIGSDGGFELGKYVDFHKTSTDTSDYSIRLSVPDVSGIIVTLPSKAGTLALVGDQVSGAGYAKKLYKIDSTNRTWTTAADIVGNGLVYYSDQSASGRWADYGSIFQFSNVDNPDPGVSGHWVTQLWSSTSNKLGVRWRTNTGSWSSMQTILTDGNYSSTLNSKYVTLDTTQTITAIKTFGDIVIPSGKYIYGINESGGAMIHFNGSKTIVGSIGESSTAATHIRSVTQHATVGNNSVSYDILDEGNYASILDSRYIKASGDTMEGVLSKTVGESAIKAIYTDNTYLIFGEDSTGTIIRGSKITFQNQTGASAFRITEDELTYYSKKVWHEGNDGSGSGLDADKLDGLQGSSYAKTNQSPAVDLNTVNGFGIMCNELNANATTERHYPIAEAGTLFYGTAAYASANQIYGAFKTNRWFARGGGSSSTAKTAWREFAFTDSNVASATKLATKRTIWGQGFDGTANVTGALSSVTNITMNDYLRIYASSSDTTHQLNLSAEATYAKIQSNGSIPLSINPDGNNVAIGATTSSYKLWVNGTAAGTTLYATTGYIYCTKGWFQNDTAGTGLYNKSQNARWQANGGVWNADKPIISSGYIKSTVATGTAPIQVASTTACTNLNADLLDGYQGIYYSPGVHFGTNVSRSSGYHKISITNYSNWMLYFKVRIYQGYNYYELDISGYNYGTNHWYSPKARLISSNVNSINVVFGYDSDNHLWIAIPAANYTGIFITDITNGYTQIGRYNIFSISYVASLTGTSQTTVTAYRQIASNESVSSASKLSPGAKINGTTFTGSGDITTSSWGTSRSVYIQSSNGTGNSSAVLVNGSGNIYLKLPATITATLSGNATSASKLATARTLWGKSFNGSANISGDMTSVGNITMSGGYIYNARGMRDTRSTTQQTEFYKNWGTSYTKLVFDTGTGTNSGFVPSMQLQAGAGGLQVNTHAENSTKRTYFWVGYSTSRGAKAIETTGYCYAARLYSNGTQVTSDIRLKNRISTYKCDLYDKLKNITPFYYTRKGEENQICLGFSANEINHAFPEFIDKQQDLNNKYCQHYYTVDFATFGSLVAVMGYKELYRKNLEQIKKTDKIEKRVAKLTKKYRELKKLVDQLLLNNE